MANSKNFTNEHYSTNILEGLNKLRTSGLICDVVLEIEEQIFPAHRCVLISACKYFENMLKGNYVESQKETINMKELNSNAFRILLDYIYTGVLSINYENACEILKLSDFLQLKWAKEKCGEYLVDSLNSENAVKIWECARECFCDELQNQANKLILSNLKDILNTEQFKKLNLEKLEEIFQHDKILSIPADDIFAAIIEWIKHDLPNRKLNFNVLSKYIKTESVSKEFLKSDISKQTFLREDNSILNWMLDNLWFSKIQDNINLGNMNIFITSLRSELNCYKYDTKMNQCTYLIKKPPREYYYPVYYKNNIYLTSGKVNGKLTNVCPKYNIETKIWSEMPFKSERDSHGSCILNDKMYIVGGRNGMNQCLNDVKMYDFEIGQLFSFESKMTERRAYFGISVENGCIYTCGGGNFHVKFNSVERFDPREGKWILISNMEDLRGDCTAAIVPDGLYCGSRETGIIKKFDIRLNTWEKILNLPLNEDNDNCLVENQGKLYAVTKDNILQFNRNENNWKKMYSESMFSLNPDVIAISL